MFTALAERELFIKDVSFVCADNFSNIVYDTVNCEVVENKLQLKSVTSTFTVSTGNGSNNNATGYNRYIAKYKIPSQPGAISTLEVLKCKPSSYGSNGSGKFVIYADNNGTPGALLWEDSSTKTYDQGIFYDSSTTANFAGLVGGDYFWFGIRFLSGSDYRIQADTGVSVVIQEENLGNLYGSSDGVTWNNMNRYMTGAYFTYNYRPLSGTYTKDLIMSSVSKWEQLSGFNPITPANTTHTLAIKDINDNILIAEATDPQSLSAISNVYTILKLMGTLSRTVGAGTDTPSISPFILTYINNVIMPTQWANKGFITSAGTGNHEVNTHVDIIGSGYLVGFWMGDSSSTITYGIQIDGGAIYKVQGTGNSSNTVGGGFTLIRFNKSLKATGSGNGSSTRNVWVVLD